MIKLKDLIYIAIIVGFFFYFKNKIKPAQTTTEPGSSTKAVPAAEPLIPLPWSWLPPLLPQDPKILDYTQPVPAAINTYTDPAPNSYTPPRPTAESATKQSAPTAGTASKFTDDVEFVWPHRRKRTFKQ